MEGETIMVTITLVLGATTCTLQGSYNKVLEWEEEESTDVAIKDVPTKTTGTVETEVWTATPKSYALICRLTATEKSNLETIEDSQSASSTADLKEDGVKKDDVWVEDVRCTWQGDEDWNAPWRVEIKLRKIT